MIVVLTGVGVLVGVWLMQVGYAAERREQIAAVFKELADVRKVLEKRDGGAMVFVQVERLRRELNDWRQDVEGLDRDVRDRLDRVLGLLTTGREDW